MIKQIFFGTLSIATIYVGLHYIYMPKVEGEIFLRGAEKYLIPVADGGAQEQIVIKRDRETGITYLEGETEE